jgi:hypothetical protein
VVAVSLKNHAISPPVGLQQPVTLAVVQTHFPKLIR